MEGLAPPLKLWRHAVGRSS